MFNPVKHKKVMWKIENVINNNRILPAGHPSGVVN